MNQTRLLNGRVVGVSISAAEDFTRRHGLEGTAINTITVELCRRLISLGGRVALGHKWRPNGVMDAVSRFASAYHGPSSNPIILNFLAYPDRAALSEQDRENLRRLVAIHDDQPKTDDRPAALRLMREQMAEITHARICLGGPVTPQEDSSVPGIVEEAVLTLQRGKPVYFSNMLGGVTEVMIATLIDRRVPAWETMGGDHAKTKQYWEYLASFGNWNLAKLCGLEEEGELERLFNSQNVDTVLQLTCRGLMKVEVRPF